MDNINFIILKSIYFMFLYLSSPVIYVLFFQVPGGMYFYYADTKSCLSSSTKKY